MRAFSFILIFCAAAWSLCAQQSTAPNPVLGVVTSAHDFVIGTVDEKPETGPIAVVSGDEISSASSPVMFRLTGDNRAVLAENSKALIRSYQPAKDKPEGIYFYQTKGALQYDARREPLAICARDRLYVPSVPGSGIVTILPDNKVQVTLTTGKMERSGSETCHSSGIAALPVEAVAAPSAAAPATTATATATAVAAGGSAAGAAVATVAAISIATATAAGVVAGVVTAQAPPSQSPTIP